MAFKQIVGNPCFIVLFGLVVGIIILSVTISLYQVKSEGTVEDDALVIKNLISNLNSTLIQDLIVTQGSCSSDYTSVRLGNWPGIVSGCLVRGNVKYECEKRTYKIGNKTYTERIGDPISSVDAKPISNWEHYSFCVKYNSDYRWQSGLCTSGYKKCQPGLCVSEKEKCPVTKVELVNNKETSNSDDVTLFPFRNSQQVKISRADTSSPIVSVQTTYHGMPCYAQGRNTKPTYSLYLLLRGSYDCGVYGEDDGPVLLDTLTENDLTSSNSLYGTLSAIPKYSTYMTNSQVYLSYTPRIALETKQSACTAKRESKGQGLDFLADLSGYDYVMIMNIVFEILIICMWFVMFCMHKSGVELSWMNTFCPLTAVVVINVIMFMMFWFGIRSTASNAMNLNSGFTDMRNSGCFKDNIYVEAIDNFDDFLSKTPAAVIGKVNWIVSVFVFRFVGIGTWFFFREKNYFERLE